MSTVLTSWNAIAHYLNKGVRTVQRWETQMGLPVRRPNGGSNGIVFAICDELDAWVRSQQGGNGDGQFELPALRRELAKLKRQNQLLRVRLDRAEARAAVTPSSEFAQDGLTQLNPYHVFSANPLITFLLRSAIAATLADFGNVQLFDSANGALRIVAQRGFGSDFLTHFAMVRDQDCACGTAMQRGSRVAISDVEDDPIFRGTHSRDVLLRADVRSVQSTPLIGRSGELIGIISTHYRHPNATLHRSWKYLDQIITAFLKTADVAN